MYARLMSNTYRKVLEQSPVVFQPLLDHHLSKMRKGQLVIKDEPSGREFRYGNGPGMSAHIRVMDSAFFRKVVLAADIGLGESYVDGDWETDDIGAVIRWFIMNLETMPSMSGGQTTRNLAVNALAQFNKMQHSFNRNSLSGSKKNIRSHYDLGNEFFQSFLDSTMTYSSALFGSEAEEDLASSQLNKMRNIADMAGVKSHHKILEIGTGWGEFSCYLAQRFGCHVTTLTISDQQFSYARNKVRQRGLEQLITIINQDYRTFHGTFDRIFTVEMLEAVGHDFLPEFFQQCDAWLKPTGKMVHQVILSPDSRYDSFRSGVDWIQKHIFPGSLLPSVSALLKAANVQSEFVLTDYKDMGLDYARTLRVWRKNFEDNFPNIEKLGFDVAFRRKWNYYFDYCEAAFAMRNITVAQIGMTRPNNNQAD